MNTSENNWHRVAIPGFPELHDIEVSSSNITEEIDEICAFIGGLASHGAIKGVGSEGPDATHELVMGPNGRKRVVRKRFT